MLGLLIDSASDLTSLELHQPHLLYPKSSINVAYGSRQSRNDKGTRATEKDDMDLQALDVLLKRLLAKNKSLSTLRMIGIDTQTLVSNEVPSRAQPLFRAICDFKCQLTVIDIQDHSQHISNLSPRLLRQLLSSVSDTVEELSISLSVSDHVDESTLYPGRTVEGNGEDKPLLSTSRNSTTFPLRKLLIRGAMKGFGRYIWNDYLKGCRRVRSLTLGWTRDDLTDNSTWILSCLSKFVNLEELDLASWTTLEDHEIAAFLQIPHGLDSTRGPLVTSSGNSLSMNRTMMTGTGLRVLRVPGTDRFGTKSIQSLLQPHITGHIEKLSLIGCGANIRSRILTELLRSCPKLASLETMCRWESPRTRSVRLYAKWMDMSSRPWACTNLTVLKLMIVGVRGSTLAPSSSSGASLQVASQHGEMESGLTSGLLGTGYSQTFTRTMSLQGDQRMLQEKLAAELERHVCAQLGALVHLQELSLGLQFRETFGSWDYNTNQPQFDLDQVRMDDEELDEPDNEPSSFEGGPVPDFYSQYVSKVETLHDFELDYFERGNKTVDEDAINHEGYYSNESDDEYDEEDNVWDEEPPPPSPGFQSSSECLHLSLARGGLQLLSDLKQLRILNVQSMGHRIRLPELMWMVSNWPRLRILEGLFASQDPNPDLDKVNNGPMQPQRPSGHVEGMSDSDSDSSHSHRASLPSWDSRSNSRTERFYWSAERQKMAEEFLRETSPNLVLKHF
ncbi:hypothetical protein EMPS_11375 [Entomortierella parvispora]|uniref:Uncharacterized protein n=1 Tax=Entomortierella parvispora TaxID=205924 RepID=A0A9P3M1W6_9FUNG|nr:hypothetical protein EMPS_11375 [Entomortierella parvispora]